MINGLKQAFKLDEDVVQYGLQMFKYAANANFCQGRRISIVAACSLYAAARASKSEKFNQSNFRNYQCKVMLIDFADHLGVSYSKMELSYFYNVANFYLDQCLSSRQNIQGYAR